MIILKPKSNNFVIADKHWINDKRLSLKARGILIYLLSKPEGWHVQLNDIVNQSPDGIRSVRAGIKELTDLRYMIGYTVRVGNRIVKWDHAVMERPLPKNKKALADLHSLLCGFVQVQSEQVQNVQVRFVQVQNSTLNKKVVKQVLKQPNNEGINNNKANGSGAGGDQKNVVVVNIPIKNKKSWDQLKNKIMAATSAKIDNKAGLFRKGIRSGEKPWTKEQIEKQQRKEYNDEWGQFFEN